MVNRREKLSRQYLHVVCSEFTARRRLWDVKPLPLKRRGRPGRKLLLNGDETGNKYSNHYVNDFDDDDDDDDEEYNKPLKVILTYNLMFLYHTM